MKPLCGRIIHIDLTAGTYAIRDYQDEWLYQCLAGRGFNLYHFFNEIDPGIAPFDPENPLMLTCGLLVGTCAPAATRLHVNARSPLTGILGSSNVGSNFALALRSLGYQGMMITGRSPSPVYLTINPHGVTFHNADSLWGKTTRDVFEYFEKNESTRGYKVLTIGPAGENSVLFACIMAGWDHSAGRTGMGAVMGSKNLKAIAVSGKRTEKRVPDPTERDSVKRYIRKITQSPEFKNFSKFGGAGYVKWCNDMEIMATRNYRSNRFTAAERLDGKQLKSHVVQKKGCRGCPVACKADLIFSAGKHKGRRLARPEFESMLNLGPKCGIDDLRSVVFLDNLCSDLGMDSISGPSAIAFAMELYERGIIDDSDTGGLELYWGNASAAMELLKQMAYQQGFGAVLSQGVKRASDILGNGAADHAPHVKGLELCGYHPEHIMGSALAYAVSGRGGDFNHVFASLEYQWEPEKGKRYFGTADAVDIHKSKGKGQLIRRAMIVNCVLDCLGLCKVPALSLIGDYDLENEADLVSAITGIEFNAQTLYAVGEQLINMERLINLKFGLTRADDNLPQMFKQADTPQSPGIPLRSMVDEFYTAMHWDYGGVPEKKEPADIGLKSKKGKPI